MREKADSMAFATMADFTHGAVPRIPANLAVAKIGAYDTGSADIDWTAADLAKYTGKVIITIDQSPQGLKFAAGTARVLDIENGAATVADAVTAVPERQKRGQYSTIYVSAANLAGLQDTLEQHGVKMNKVGFWLADWDLSQEQAVAKLGNEIVAIQWASPTTNPNTILPGTSLTLKEANADLSVTTMGWYPPAVPKPSWESEALSKVGTLLTDLAELEALLKAHQ
jgi:hypothetical protein